MASWMVHLRVADKLLSIFPSLMPTEFVVGNIAPDSGLPNEDGTAYTPDKDGSHFRTGHETRHPRPDPTLFASLYLTPEQLAGYTAKERSFYLGYYAHLLTDVAWSKNIFMPSTKQFREEYEKDPFGFINGPLKRDWYDLDYLYLKEHPSFRAWGIYKAAEGFDNTYIDRFARHAFADRQQFIVWFYSQQKDNLEREYPYLTKERAEEFVEETAAEVAEVLKQFMSAQRLFLEIPNESHEKAYTEMMDRWEASGETIAPQLLSRYSSKLNGNVPYSRWLEWCEDDRTTGAALSTGVPCTLYFLVNNSGDILGSIVINHGNTHRGHLHAGIAPWNRGKGYGTAMLELALAKCREMGITTVDIVPYDGNHGAVKVIEKNGGVPVDEFFEDGRKSLRYQIVLR